ncbi:F-box/LRR-repeat protein At2g42720-like [Henckelia pumila]|uniref:F-box/LRR-repeat protein At2g42720-like n=1 Tax=Henckelia pumila TaxID=405737 RepID=UPI003C6E1E58
MKNKSENGVVDEISELPDDVLVSIISRLTWREATATSVISTRWRHVYTYITRLHNSNMNVAVVEVRDMINLVSLICFKLHRKPTTPNEHLKKVTLSGYIVSPDDLRLASYIIRQAEKKLKRLIVKFCHKTPEIQQQTTALSRKHLQQITTDTIHLIIL